MGSIFTSSTSPRRHPLVLGTAAFSLLATALPSSALGGNSILSAFAAASTSSSSLSSITSFGGSLHHSTTFSTIEQPASQTNNRRRSLFGIGGASTRRSISCTTERSMSARGGGGAAAGSNNDGATTHETPHKSKTYPHAPLATVSPFSRPVKNVMIVGGTHGNEYTGVWCIKAIEKQREIYVANGNTNGDNNNSNSNEDDEKIMNVFDSFPTLDMNTLLGNPVAYMQNKRFVDMDLNREFSIDKLKRVPINGDDKKSCDIRTDFCTDDDVVDSSPHLSSLPHEALRAREIEAILGPKLSSHSPNGDNISLGEEDVDNDPLTDVVIDLHTTTCNMGISLIIPEGDALMSAAAAYVMHQCRTKYGYDSVQCLMHALPKRKDRMNLSSCGRHGFTIEVGPVPQGVLRHDKVEQTEAALHSLLEFLHLRNLELEREKNDGSDANDDGDNAATTANTVLDKLRLVYQEGTVPCYRSAPAVRPGELSGKISWPNDPTNPNFPAVLVHKSLQDRDFQPLRVGDPLFVSLDGTIIPYDGSHGDEVHLIFVNEGGYYYASSGTGIGVAVKSQFDWETGWFVVEEDGGLSEEVVVEEKDSYE